MAVGVASRLRQEAADGLFEAYARSCDHARGAAATAAWLAERGRREQLTADPVPLGSLTEWRMDHNASLRHTSGRFFSIHGWRAEFAYRARRAVVERPIIQQPEVGLLGFLGKVRDGVLWLLAQSKDEPGNVSGPQLSPTVQATFSNYTRVHGGKPVPFVSHFQDPALGVRVLSQLQAEHGAYFVRKRNLNSVVLVDDVDFDEARFRWVTLGELLALLKLEFRVSMDTRSVLSCLFQEMACRFAGRSAQAAVRGGGVDLEFRDATRESAFTRGGALHSDVWVAGWFRAQQAASLATTQLVSLCDLPGWQVDDQRVSAANGVFDVAGFAVRAPFRERAAWSQPLFVQKQPGVVGWICQKHRSRLHFLCRASLEPGETDAVCIGPSVVGRGQPSPGCFGEEELEDLLFDASATLQLSVRQSEEGGRFYRFIHEHRVVELPEGFAFEAPPGFAWLTLHQIHTWMARQRLTIEARNLLACLDIGGET